MHPSLLDRQGLVACWREGLLAQAVLTGRTRGYRFHPQLVRFRAQPDPLSAIGSYLDGVRADAQSRGYRFDAARIITSPASLQAARMPVTRGQLEWEWSHLLDKLQLRSSDDYSRLVEARPRAHPLFLVVPGPVEEWETAAHS